MKTPGRLAAAALVEGERGAALRVYGVRLGESAEELKGLDETKREVSFATDGGVVSRIYLARDATPSLDISTKCLGGRRTQ